MPLGRTFARVAPHGAHVGAPEGAGWSTTAELAGPQLDAALELAGRSLGTERPDISGQRLVELVAWRLAVPAAAALLADARLPDLSAENTLVWIGDEPPDGIGTALRTPAFYALPTDPDADQATLVPDEAALLHHLRATLADDHIAPLAQAVNTATQRPIGALWRSATDRLVAAMVWVGELTGHRDRACELARAATDGQAELRMLKAGETRDAPPRARGLLPLLPRSGRDEMLVVPAAARRRAARAGDRRLSASAADQWSAPSTHRAARATAR